MTAANESSKTYLTLNISKRPAWIKILATAILVCMASLIKYLLRNYIGHGTPFLIYFGFIMLCGRFIGFWYGIAATIIFGIIATIYFVLPYEGLTVASVSKIVIYGLEGYFISSLSNSVRRRMETAELAHLNFVTLISKSKDGLAKFSASGKILFMSPSIEVITGLTIEALERSNFDIFPTEMDKKIVSEHFLRIVKDPGESVSFTHQYYNGEKKKKWMETIFTNCLQVNGVNAVVANFRDVSERVEADNRKNEFIGVISHEVKNPLTVLQFTAEMQEEIIKKTNDPQLIQMNAILKNSSKRMALLLNDLLNYSGFETSLLNMQLQEITAGDVIRQAVAGFAPVSQHPVQVSGTVNARVKADISRIEQVLLNLLSNAAKYSPEGRPIFINCEIAGDKVIFSVRDEGIGIPAAEQANLFNKFYRVPGDQAVKGFGLGLYICAAIVKAHEGTIGVQSVAGAGATFWFSLPSYP
jgi:PAS domain S-box-containing protein